LGRETKEKTKAHGTTRRVELVRLRVGRCVEIGRDSSNAGTLSAHMRKLQTRDEILGRNLCFCPQTNDGGIASREDGSEGRRA